jgi:hypothetical protein
VYHIQSLPIYWLIILYIYICTFQVSSSTYGILTLRGQQVLVTLTLKIIPLPIYGNKIVLKKFLCVILDVIFHLPLLFETFSIPSLLNIHINFCLWHFTGLIKILHLVVEIESGRTEKLSSVRKCFIHNLEILGSNQSLGMVNLLHFFINLSNLRKKTLAVYILASCCSTNLWIEQYLIVLSTYNKSLCVLQYHFIICFGWIQPSSGISELKLCPHILK